MRLKIIGVLISVFLLMFMLIGCQAGDNNDHSDTQSEKQEENDVASTETETESEEASEGPSAEIAEALALDFSLTDGKGNQVNLADYQDKFVFLNFFTTWCGYCMDEMPEFQKVYDEYKEDIEIVIVNVNFDANEVSTEEVVKWYEDSGYTFPMVIDEDGSQTQAFYPYVTGYPTTFVYDKGGKYLGYIPGALNEQTMIDIINNYMK